MRSALIWLSFLAFVCLLGSGCSPQPDVVADDSDNGGRVELRRGQILDIVLPDDYKLSNAQWRDEQAYDTSILDYLGSRYEPDRTLPGHTGAGTYTSRYKAAGAGTVHVTLVQEDNADPPHVARHFALDVSVK